MWEMLIIKRNLKGLKKSDFLTA